MKELPSKPPGLVAFEITDRESLSADGERHYLTHRNLHQIMVQVQVQVHWRDHKFRACHRIHQRSKALIRRH